MHEIIPRLWVGSVDEAIGDDVDLIVTLVEAPPAEVYPSYQREVRIVPRPEPSGALPYGFLSQAARTAIAAVDAGQHVLIRCSSHGHLSRLVAAIALRESGCEPEEALVKVRAGAPYALTRGAGPVLVASWPHPMPRHHDAPRRGGWEDG